MSYIGFKPVQGSAHLVDEFTSSGGSTYTLSSQPTNKDVVEVVVGGLTQSSSAYSFSGTTLTLAGVASGTKIIVRQHGEKLLTPIPGDDSVTGAKIADNALDSEHYVDGSIDTAHIADGAITAAKIADGTVVAAEIASNAVTTVKIIDDAVTTAKIADANITTALIADDAVTAAKIADAVALGGPSLGTSSIIRTNAKTISENITFAGNENGMTVGPITVANNYSVIVTNGSTWTIV
jgi:hypothetical protein